MRLCQTGCCPTARSAPRLFKGEVIRWLGPLKTADAVEWKTLQWVDWFNNRRPLRPVENIPPAEAEKNFYDQCSEFDKVA